MEWLFTQFERVGVTDGEVLPWFCRLLAIIVMPDRVLRGFWNSRFYDARTDCYTIEGVRISRAALRALGRGCCIQRSSDYGYEVIEPADSKKEVNHV